MGEFEQGRANGSERLHCARGEGKHGIRSGAGKNGGASRGLGSPAAGSPRSEDETAAPMNPLTRSLLLLFLLRFAVVAG